MRLLAFTVFVLLTLGFSACRRPVDDSGDRTEVKNSLDRTEVKNDLDRIQGDWQVVSAMEGGKSASADHTKKMVWRFEGNKVINLSNGDVRTISLDPTKSPATIDLVNKAGGREEGIYKFAENDKLTLAFQFEG